MAEAVEKEHMFDKVVTPSDVGKLNRLVVPKQFAERHILPRLLGGAANAACSGAVLRFEDGRGGGRACITARVYPEHAENGDSHLYVFNNGTGAVKVAKLDAYELATATVNVGDDGLIQPSSMRRGEA